LYERNPNRRPLSLAYFGKVDPRDLGISYRLPPMSSTDDADEGDMSLEPGWYALSAALMHGFEWVRVPDGAGGRVDPVGKP